MAWLVITSDDGSERVVELGSGNLRIGRGAGNDIILPDASKGVSRAHAELRFDEGRYVIVDLQSQNGTWLNGQRVQRAELPPDAEITVGTYRLRKREGKRPMATTAAASDGGTTADAPWPEVVISRPMIAEDAGIHGVEPEPAADKRPAGLFLVVVIAALVLLVVAVWQFVLAPGDSEGTSSASAPAPESQIASAPAAAAAPPPSEASAPTIVADPPVVPESPGTAAGIGAPAPVTVPPRRSTAASRAAALPPVPRRPSESVEAWRTRIAALEARYDYSKAALDRGDFGSAASGFDAILREEPGFLDAPVLLVQARAGLRAAALDVVDAGNRLDAAGDWFGALQQYERAREVDAGTPGVDPAVKRVREKLRVAGQEALDRGRDYERGGRPAAALQEYDKAVQWLPNDDPNREVARARAEQLRNSPRD